MKILVLDNYDSFTYNLVQQIRELGMGDSLSVYRNDKIPLDAVAQYDKILLSPGPGLPSEAGIMPELIRQYGPLKQILGVCLGHQGIAEGYGGSLYNMEEVQHGVVSKIIVQHPADPLFQGVPLEFDCGRYHSWSVARPSLKAAFTITAEDAAGTVMAIRHKSYDLVGLQFHPESIMTPHGHQLIANWLKNG